MAHAGGQAKHTALSVMGVPGVAHSFPAKGVTFILMRFTDVALASASMTGGAVAEAAMTGEAITLSTFSDEDLEN